MALGIDIKPMLAQITASAEATDRLADAISRLAEATERANELTLTGK